MSLSSGAVSSHRAVRVSDFLWIRTPDDGVWWPAVVVKPPEEFEPLLGEELDACVQLFHAGDDVFLIDSTDANAVRLLDWAQRDRDALFFQPAILRGALQRADARRAALMQSVAAIATKPPTTIGSTGGVQFKMGDGSDDDDDDDTPYTEEELLKFQRLIGALGNDVAAQVRTEMRTKITPSTASRAKKATDASCRAPRTTSRRVTEQDAGLGGNTPAVCASVTTRDDPNATISNPASVVRPTIAADVPTATSSWGAAPAPEQGDALAQPQDDPIYDESALEVLRMEVFDNRDKLILDPLLKYVELLGAVSIESRSMQAVLPTRSFLYENNHRPCDRVVLIPIDPTTFAHTLGWMERVELDGGHVLDAELFVNGHKMQTPSNWRIPASKERTAVRTAIPLDITDIIECTLPDEEGFELRVHFTAPDGAADLTLWDAALACVLVEQIPLEQVCATIRGTCRTNHKTLAQRRGQRARQLQTRGNAAQGGQGRYDGVTSVGCETQEVSFRCPLTSVALVTPCRGAQCEHPQCMELTAVVSHCAQRHVWNCPLCNCAMPPDEILVDYPLLETLRANKPHDKIDAVLWNERTASYTVRAKRARTEAQHIVDD